MRRAPDSKKIKRRVKAILKGLLLILLCLFLIVGSIKAAQDILFDAKTIHHRKRADFKKKQKSIRLLFMGQSDMEAAVIPSLFVQKSFNYSESTEFFIGTYYKLKDCIQNMPLLETVVLPVSFGSFQSVFSKKVSARSYEFINREDLRDLSELKGWRIYFQKYKPLKYILAHRQLKDFVHNIGRLMLSQPISKSVLTDGHMMLTGTSVTSDQARATVHRFFGNSTSAFDADLLLYFKKILMLCHENNICVITVTLPKTDFYIDSASQYTTMKEVYENVLENSEYCRYIFYHFDYLTEMSNAHHLFNDANHLNYEGAQIFSIRFSEDINKVWQDYFLE